MSNGKESWRRKLLNSVLPWFVCAPSRIAGFLTVLFLQRVMSHTLNHWTTRVADIKFRELEVNQKVEKAMLV